MDGGQTWSQAKIIVDTKERQQTIGNIIVVGPDGTLFDFTDLIESPNTPRQGTRSNVQLAFVKSLDGGDNWNAPQVIARVDRGRGVRPGHFHWEEFGMLDGWQVTLVREGVCHSPDQSLGDFDQAGAVCARRAAAFRYLWVHGASGTLFQYGPPEICR